MKLSDETRKKLADQILESHEYALRLHREGPRLVSEAVWHPSLMRRLSQDPVLFTHLLLGFKPTNYQRELLKCPSKRILVRWPRQSGKTMCLAIKALWHAVFHADTTTLIIAPSQRQSMILSDVIHSLIDRIPEQIRRANIKRTRRTVIYLKNRSRIVSLPNSENLLRGYTAHLVICDEAAFFRNDEAIFQHVLTPMLATTDGTMIVSSTPWGKQSIFYAFNMDPDWTKLHITWREAQHAGIYTTDFVKQIQKTSETRPITYRMEYEAEFVEDHDTWLTQNILAKAVDHDLDYHPFNRGQEGNFYLGIDLGERVDHSALAALKRSGDTLLLVHMHQFPLGTSLASVIGYTKVLHNTWQNIHAVNVDNTKHGDYIIQHIIEAGVPETKGVTFTQNSKQEMAQILKQRMTEGTLSIPYDRTLLDELNTQRYTLTKTGRIALDHPPGTHDDRFWALALAAHAAQQPTPSRPTAKTT